MKKIEEAARQFALMYADEGSKHFHPLRLAFRGGAKHVLDAMTSDETIKNAVKRVIADSGGFGEDQTRTAVMAAGRAIDAVRKEIEGE